MGNAGRRPERVPPQEEQEKAAEPTALERWEASEKSLADVQALLSVAEAEEAGEAILGFLRGVAKREKYQHYLLAVMEHLQGQPARARLTANARRELFSQMSSRMRASFFVAQDFPDAHLQTALRAAQQLLFLYEYCGDEEAVQRALFFNFPAILSGFPEFLRLLLDEEVLISQDRLTAFVLPVRRIDEIREWFETALESETDKAREELLTGAAAAGTVREAYVRGVEQALRFDYAQLAGSLLQALQSRGHELSEGEVELWAKVEVYCVLLYDLNQLALPFSALRPLSLSAVLHLFFASHDLTHTHLLASCFHVFPDPASEWDRRLRAYLFSPQAHLSTLLRLLELKHLRLTGSADDLTLLLNKVRSSRTDIGRYADQLTALVLSFQVPQLDSLRFQQLTKLVEVFNVFGISQEVEPLYAMVYAEEEERGTLAERGLEVVRRVVAAWFECFEAKQRSLTWQETTFTFASVFELLRFVQFLKRELLRNFISDCATHQVFFRELISHEHYVEVKALLSPERASEFGIESEPIEMIVSDHIIHLVTGVGVKREEEGLRVLLSVLGLYTGVGRWHYLLSYYHFFKYLEEREVALPLELREPVCVQQLRHLATAYPLKLEQLDFDLLFAHQSCIRVHYTDPQEFLPIVTDEFLKFKVFLASRAFAAKRTRLAHQAIEEVLKFEPPWMGTELVRLLKENPALPADEGFLSVVFGHCARGEDLELLLGTRGKQVGPRATLQRLKEWASMGSEEEFLQLSDQLVLGGPQFTNLVAELTFNEGGDLRAQHALFFHLLPVEPQRAFNYALNYAMPPVFVVNFVLEGAKRTVLRPTVALPFLLRFLSFAAKREAGQARYVSLREYLAASLEGAGESGKSGGYAGAALERTYRNWQAQQLCPHEFLQLYVLERDHFRFLFEEPFRREQLVALREQPMSKPNARTLRALCSCAGVDVLEVSLYQLTTRANSRGQLDDEAWTVTQKLAHWGEEPGVAAGVLRRLAAKTQTLSLLLPLLEYLAQSEPTYSTLATPHHLQLIRSLAAVQTDCDLHGILPQDFFDHPLAPRSQRQRGQLSQSHRALLRRSACLQNIFVVSKALYFIYGCSEEVEKVVLGEFSLQQPDSEEFELLRKKVRQDAR